MIIVVIITLISWGGHRDFPDDSKWVFGCNVMISMICSRDSTRADWHCCHWRRCWWRRDLNEGQTTDTKAVRALLIKGGKSKKLLTSGEERGLIIRTAAGLPELRDQVAFALVLPQIGWERGANFRDQSKSELTQNQSNPGFHSKLN